MKNKHTYQPNPKLDLVFERTVDVPVEKVWAAWTKPELLKQWFTPKPWMTVDCEIDLYPGGKFKTVMKSPEGQLFPGEGCYLEVVENERLVWTSVLLGGYRPGKTEEGGIPFTGVISLERNGSGTKYTAIAIHGDEDACQRHEKMGFREGWGAALDQLVALMKS